MPTLVATAGSSSANAYATVAEGDTYADERLQAAAWTAEDTDDKERALIMATRRIDEEEFVGYKNADSQALAWPREGVVVDDVELSTSAVPDLVKRATFELALAYLKSDDSSEDPLANSGLEKFKNVKVGPIDVTPRFDAEGGDLPDDVLRILDPVLTSGRYSARLWRA